MAFNASDDANFKYDSDLNLDGFSTLSFHRVGKNVHIRIQHQGDEEYAVAVIKAADVQRVSWALSELGD